MSDILVPGLRQEFTEYRRPDVLMSFGPEPDWVREAMCLPFRLEWPRAGALEGDDSAFALTSLAYGEYFHLSYGNGVRFFVDRAAKRIWGNCSPPLTEDDLGTYLLGPVMGFILRRRGITALHASAVCVSEHSVVLCGPSESGKSTTAAALALRGVPVLTDDISQVTEENGSLNVEPGYPRVCLWPEAVKTLFGAPQALPRLTPTWEKCFLELDGAKAKFEPQRKPLGVVYLFGARVEEADAPRIEDLSRRDALLELVQNTYMNWLLDRDQRGGELDVLTKLVTDVPVRRIVPHADPARLGALCELILKDGEQVLAQQALAAVGSSL